VTYDSDAAMRKGLREPFPKEQIGKLPATQKRPALDFVGHAAVVDRLNRYAPDWTYSVDEMFSMGETCWVKGTLTVGGVSRVEYGDGADPKEAIGNWLRRAAMRFGVALDLWSREELDWEAASVDVEPGPSSIGRSAGAGKAETEDRGGSEPFREESERATDPVIATRGEGGTGPLHTSEVASLASEGSDPAPSDAASLSEAVTPSTGTEGEESVVSSAGDSQSIEEQKKAYYDAFRAGPGLPNAYMAAKKLFSTEARPIKRWNDFYALSPDELFEVARYFEDQKVSA
jgi:hypothetical protein